MGNGQQIRIREDRWLERGVLGGPNNQQDPNMVVELIDSIGKQWKGQLLGNLFEEQVINEILATPLPIISTEDKLVWSASQFGYYSVKSGYNQLRKIETTQDNKQASTSYQMPNSLWGKIWKLKTLPKVRFFMWSICQNTLPTRVNLYKRKLLPEPYCPMCRKEP